jgi:hypothetical protein
VLDKVYEGYENYPITQALIDEAIQPCLDFFDLLDAELGPLSFHVEKRVNTAIPGIFGTCDIIGRGPNGSIMVDWKFGAGVQVYAWYTDERDEVIPNEQLMLYLLGAAETFPEMFEIDDPKWPVEICIAQPRFRDGPNFDRLTVTIGEVEAFQLKLAEAAKLAKGDNPPMAKGAHCRFMACKTICPLHTGPMLDTSAIGEMLAKAQLKAQLQASVVQGDPAITEVDWGRTYSLMLELATRLEPVISEWRSQAQAYLEEGGEVPGYKLVNKRATRKWVKADKSVERKLARLGLTKDERMPRVLLSAPAAEKALKKIGETLPEGYFDAISSGLTLASDADPRQAVQPVGDVIAALTSSLAAITR